MASSAKTDAGRYRVRWREDGKQRSRNFRTAREAANFKAELEGRDPRDGILFRTLASRWLENRQVGLAATTKVKYDWLLRLINAEFGDRRVRTITFDDVERFVATMIGTYSWANAQNAKAMLSSIFKYGLRQGEVSANPAEFDMPTNQTKKADPEMITEVQLHQLAELAGGYGPLVLITGYGGLRWSEAIALRPRDLALDRSRLRVARQLVLVHGRFDETDPKTQAGTRTVRLAGVVVESLRRHIADRQLGPNDLLFPGPDGGPLRANWFHAAVWDPARRRVGLDRFRWHDLRHVVASRLIARGVPVNQVAAQLGHSDVKITLALYGHLIEDHVDSLAGPVDELYAEM